MKSDYAYNEEINQILSSFPYRIKENSESWKLSSQHPQISDAHKYNTEGWNPQVGA